MSITALVAWMALPATACPTVVTGTSQPLTYDVAMIAVVRQGTRTTFTVSVNPSGEPQDFALVMPVPALLAESDIAVLDATTFENLEAYTGLLTMVDAGCMVAGTVDSDGDGMGGGGGEPGGDVQVEAEYLVGDYFISILSANDSEALFTWLDSKGYHLADATIPVLQDYIDQGMYFMAAELSPEATLADGSSLPPLQVSYDSAMFTIPIRLAAKNSPGRQDMVIHAITDAASGRVGISNYPEFTIEDKCIWGDPATDDFGDFYESHFEGNWGNAGMAAWTIEWAGRPGDCSPCSGASLSMQDLDALGFVSGPAGHYLTRLHVRYTNMTADQDLVLYESGLLEARTTSFADDNYLNQYCIDPCPPPPEWTDPGTEDPGTSSDPTTTGDDDDDDAAEASPQGTDASTEGCGCATVTDGGLGLVTLGMIIAVARRRRYGV